ncbi:MAG: hypothetical protein H6711_10650 [Myxococcales bacterium]|nr:hypothetical protein [Myxococcales bacterium]
MIARSPLLPSAAILLLLAACPQQVEPSPQTSTPLKRGEVGADDPRVVADTGDLYPARDEASDPSGPRGTGAPDETNGVCRLYAPKLPNPECCEGDLGLDVDVVKQACGYPLYLGESFHATCGYFFAGDESAEKAKWIRLSVTHEPTVEAAAKAHDERIGYRVANDPNFHSEPVPGVEGALWSSHERLHWAFLPGWSRPRQLTWRDDSCSNEGIIEVMKQLIAAPEVPAGAPRKSMIPRGGRPAPADAASADSGPTAAG